MHAGSAMIFVDTLSVDRTEFIQSFYSVLSKSICKAGVQNVLGVVEEVVGGQLLVFVASQPRL